MKNASYLVLLALLLLSACQPQKSGYKISGTIAGIADGEKVYLYDLKAHEDIDSVVVNNGTFEFKGNVDNTSLYFILYRSEGNDTRYVDVWVENIPISVNGNLGDFENMHIEGSAVQKQDDEYSEYVKPYKERLDSIDKAFDPTNKEEAQRLYELYEQVNNELNVAKKEFVNLHSDYYFSVYLLERLIRELEPKEGEELFAMIPEAHQSTSYGKNIKRYLTLNKNLQVGDKFSDFTLPNAQGEMVNLSELVKGKYALIDFWASWCRPCRRENPHLRKAFNQYHDKGFEIFGVSLDEQKEDWLKAVGEDNITWTAVVDTLAFNGDAAMMYNVRYIPHNFLINPEGEILAIDLRGEDFLAKVDEIFSK